MDLLMLLHLPSEWVNQNNQWVGFFSSYLGGILGGIISGLLTLGGVYLTIHEQRRKELIDSYPERRINGDQLLFLFFELGWIEEHLKEENFKEEYFERIIRECEEIAKKAEEILLMSAKVSGKFYVLSRQVVTLAAEIASPPEYNDEYPDKVNEMIKQYKALKTEFKTMIDRIEKTIL